jgi:hypothetical protein
MEKYFPSWKNVCPHGKKKFYNGKYSSVMENLFFIKALLCL